MEREGRTNRDTHRAAYREALARLCARMSPAEADALLERMQPVTVPAGAAVLRQGEPNDALLVLVEGRLRTQVEARGSERLVLGESDPGSFCGEAGLIDPGPSAVTVVAVEDSALLRLPRERLDELRRSNPRVVTLLLRALSEQLAERLRDCRTLLRREGEHELRVIEDDEAPHRGLIESLASLLGFK